MNKLKKNIIEIILQINVTSELYSELRSKDLINDWSKKIKD